MAAKIVFPLTPDMLEIRRVVGDDVNLHGKVDGVKTKTDNLPADTASILGTPTTSIAADIGTVGTNVSAIKTKTDNLPADTASILGTPTTSIAADIGAVKTVADGIKTKTDNLPTDTASVLGTPTTSIAADIGAVKTVADGIKTKTDNLPTDTAAEFTAIKGDGFASSDSLKDIKAAVLSIQNNTSFSAVVLPQMIIPKTGNLDNHILTNLYDGSGYLEDPDLDKLLLSVEVSHGALRNSNLFINASRTDPAVKIVLYTITQPTVAPTAGAVYHDSYNTSFTVIGMVTPTLLMASWTGATAPEVGDTTLTKDSGTGDATLTASAVDTSFVALEKDGVGQYSLFYNVLSTHLPENLTFRFGYYEGGVWRAVDRSTNVVSPESVSSVAEAVWNELTTTHTTENSFGVFVKDIAGSGFSSTTDSLKVISDNVDTISSNVSAIKTKTDNLPADTASALSAIDAYVDTIETNIGTPVAIDGGDATLAGMLRKLFDDGSGFDATNDSLKAIRDAIDSKPTYPTSFAGTKTTEALAQAAAETLEFSTSEGITTNNCTLFQLKVTVTGASTSATVQIYEKTGNPAGNLIYEVQGITASGVNIALVPGIIFRNADTTKINKVYVKITNVTDASTSTFAVELRGLLNAN